MEVTMFEGKSCIRQEKASAFSSSFYLNDFYEQGCTFLDDGLLVGEISFLQVCQLKDLHQATSNQNHIYAFHQDCQFELLRSKNRALNRLLKQLDTKFRTHSKLITSFLLFIYLSLLLLHHLMIVVFLHLHHHLSHLL